MKTIFFFIIFVFTYSLGCSQTISRYKISVGLPIYCPQYFEGKFENVYIPNIFYSADESENLIFVENRSIISDGITISTPEQYEFYTSFFPAKEVSYFKSKGHTIYSDTVYFEEKSLLYDTINGFYESEIRSSASQGGYNFRVNHGKSIIPITIQKFEISFSPEPEKGGYLRPDQNIVLSLSYGFPADANVYVIIDGKRVQSISSLNPKQTKVVVDAEKLFSIVGENTKYSLLVESSVYKDSYLNYEIVMPKFLPLTDENALTFYSDDSGFKKEDNISVVVEGIEGSTFDNPSSLPSGTYTIEYTDTSYENCIPAIKYLFNPIINYQFVNNSQNCFWFPTEERNSLYLEFEYTDDIPLAQNIIFKDSTDAELSYSIVRDSFEKNLIRKSDGGVIDGQVAMYKRVYAINTDAKLSIIDISSDDSKFLPLSRNISLQSYPNISAPEVTVADATCYYDSVRIGVSGAEGGLGNGYKYVLKDGDREFWSEDSELNVPSSLFGLGDRTVKLYVLDRDSIQDDLDAGGRDKRAFATDVTLKYGDRLRILGDTTSNLLCNNDYSGYIGISDWTPKNAGITFCISDSVTGEVVGSQYASGLSARTYRMAIADTNGCRNDSFFISLTEPKKLAVDNVAAERPSCYGYSDGWISTHTSGGTEPYTYLWNTGSESDSIYGIPVGDYWMVVDDQHGCTDSIWRHLDEPDDLKNSLEPQYVVCDNSSLKIDDGDDNDFEHYEWTAPNGDKYYERIITVTNPTMPSGKYVLKSTMGECYTLDTTEVSFSSEKMPLRFLMPSEAYRNDTVVLVEDSDTTTSFDWSYSFNDGIFRYCDEITDNYKNMTYLEAYGWGSDTITMYAQSGACVASISKPIEVSSETRPEGTYGTSIAAEIFSSLQIGPNPNDGNFSLFANLTEEADLDIRLYDVSRSLKIPLDFGNYLAKSDHYEIPFDGLGLKSGVYTMLVTANGNTKQIKFVVENR